MSNELSCSFKKEFLKVTTILYVESDKQIRSEVYELFEAFFLKIIVAGDGEEALKEFKDNKFEIDIILTDAKLPKLDGLELISEIRKMDWDLPILITTNFEENDIFKKLIKLHVTDYIIKPMQLNTTFKIISLLMEEKDRKKEVVIQDNKLKQMISILDSINIVSEIDLDGNYIYANDLYVYNSGYSLDEILNSTHELIKKSSIHCEKYNSVQKSISRREAWTGDCKKITKDGDIYYTYSAILPILSKDSKIEKYVEFSTLTTKYKSEISSLKKQIVTIKSESFKNNLETKNKNSFNVELEKNYQRQIDDSIDNTQKLMLELHESKKRENYLKDKLSALEKRVNEFHVTDCTDDIEAASEQLRNM